MKISDLIAKLENWKSQYGDLRLCTWDGDIEEILISPSINGNMPNLSEKANELALDIRCEA